MVGERDGLDVGDELCGLGRLVIVMDTLAAANFSEALLALEIAADLFYGVPLKLVLSLFVAIRFLLNVRDTTTEVVNLCTRQVDKGGHIEFLSVCQGSRECQGTTQPRSK